MKIRKNINVTDPSSRSELFTHCFSSVVMDISFEDRIISASDAVTKHILHPCVVKIENEYRPGNSFNFKPVIDTSVALFLCKINPDRATHYNDVIMTTMASQITSVAVVYSIVYSDADQRKYQNSASLAFVWWIHRGPVNSPHKRPETRKMSPFDDVIISGKILCFTHQRVSFPITGLGNTAISANIFPSDLKWSEISTGFKKKDDN